MKKRTILLFPDTIKILEQMGEQIKLARLRRNLSVELVSERANISRATLWAIEKGSPSVAIGYYAAVLHALNDMDKDLLLVAKDDSGFEFNDAPSGNEKERGLKHVARKKDIRLF